MSEVERIKKILREDKNFSKSFLGVKNIKTAVAIAKSKGFNVEKEDILNDKELSDYLLEASAGGDFLGIGKWFKKTIITPTKIALDYIAAKTAPDPVHVKARDRKGKLIIDDETEVKGK